ncbi:MAG: hypothetical protein N2484_10450 [Clostridia bacterium]|nr:hypothetical protein [Clostridia bacterium]
MNLLLGLMILLLVLIILALTIAFRIKLIFSSNNANMSITLLWLYPLLKVVITNIETRMFLQFYLLNRQVFQKPINNNKGNGNNLDLVKEVKPKHVHVNAYYGFRDPFFTGVACGAINIASQFINIESLSQFPDFLADKDYIYVDATAKVKLGRALLNWYRRRRAVPST